MFICFFIWKSMFLTSMLQVVTSYSSHLLTVTWHHHRDPTGRGVHLPVSTVHDHPHTAHTSSLGLGIPSSLSGTLAPGHVITCHVTVDRRCPWETRSGDVFNERLVINRRHQRLVISSHRHLPPPELRAGVVTGLGGQMVSCIVDMVKLMSWLTGPASNATDTDTRDTTQHIITTRY